jgi:hypothetical protein
MRLSFVGIPQSLTPYFRTPSRLPYFLLGIPAIPYLRMTLSTSAAIDF